MEKPHSTNRKFEITGSDEYGYKIIKLVDGAFTLDTLIEALQEVKNLGAVDATEVYAWQHPEEEDCRMLATEVFFDTENNNIIIT